ncbi:uncharacterized protein [Centruroides vittatus]|uniref:uncharacterized protein isoform X2 n=1 Tax=Centruroides vittatus TaxID=120091 RepID=UPI0035108970
MLIKSRETSVCLPTHEVLAVSGKVILKLSDLVEWIIDNHEVDWSYGLLSVCDEDVTAPVPDVGLPPQSLEETKNVFEGGRDLAKIFTDNNCGFDIKEISREKQMGEQANPDVPKVKVLSYPRYCRYRTMLKRIEETSDSWLKNALVIALGGFTLTSHNTFILFCRDTFDHDALLQNDLNCDHLAPNLKGRPRKKQIKTKRSASPDSESNTSEENREVSIKVKINLKNGLKKPSCKDEQEFLQTLFKFMKNRNTPIHRVPHLGFKQIDLYFFYMYAQKLGGYEKITYKKLWKHVYDELGGNPGSTSAATCTRRHYERLLLPFERYMRGNQGKKFSLPPPATCAKKEKLKMKERIQTDKILRMNSETQENYDSTDESQEERHDDNNLVIDLEKNGDAHKDNIKFKVKDLKCFKKDWKGLHRSLLPSKLIKKEKLENEFKWNEKKKKSITQSWVSSTSKHSLLSKYHSHHGQENKPPIPISLPSAQLPKTMVLDSKSHLKSTPMTLKGTVPTSTSYVSKNNVKEISRLNNNNNTTTTNDSQLSNFASHERVQKSPSVNRTGRLPVRDGHYAISTTSNVNNPVTPTNSLNLPSKIYNKSNKHGSTSFPTSSSPRCCISDIKTESKAEIRKEAKHQSYVSIMSPLLYRKNQTTCLTTMANSRSNRTVTNSMASLNFSLKTLASDFVIGRTIDDITHRNNKEVGRDAKLMQRRPSVIQHTEHIQPSPPPHKTCNLCNSFPQCNSEKLYRTADRTSCCRNVELIIPKVGPTDSRCCMSTYMEANRFPHQKPMYIDSTSNGSKMMTKRLYNSIANPNNHHPLTRVSETPYKMKTPIQSSLRTDNYYQSLPKNLEYQMKSTNCKFSGPFYDQPKRLKTRFSPPISTSSAMLPPSSSSSHLNYKNSSSSSLFHFNQSQNCENEVLDLSIKKKKPLIKSEENTLPTSRATSDKSTESECLDLSIKKNNFLNSNVKNTDLLKGIEDITPPPPPTMETPVYQNSFMSPPVCAPSVLSTVRPCLDNLKLSSDIKYNRYKLNDSFATDNCASIYSNNLKLPYGSTSDVHSPLTYKLRGTAKTVCVSEYNPQLPSFITPPFYPYNSTSWTSPHYSTAGTIPTYKEFMGPGTVADPQHVSHLYPFMYNDGCMYQAYTK